MESTSNYEVVRHFVTFLSPGTFVAEDTSKPIGSWDVLQACAMARDIQERYGAKPYGFYFTTRAREAGELDSRRVATSGTYYLRGRIMTLEDVLREMPDEKILAENMRCNGFDRVVVTHTPYRWTQPLRNGDVVLKQE